MGEPIEIPSGGLTNMGPRNHYWMGVKFRCNPFAAAMGDKSAMRPFANLLSTLVFLVAVRSVQLTAWETRLQKWSLWSITHYFYLLTNSCTDSAINCVLLWYLQLLTLLPFNLSLDMFLVNTRLRELPSSTDCYWLLYALAILTEDTSCQCQSYHKFMYRMVTKLQQFFKISC